MRLTKTGTRLTLAITGLSGPHHVDHVARVVTSWPLAGGFNPFSASLFVYPTIIVGLLLSRVGRAGPRFWTILAGSGAVFILAVHLGPTAGGSVTDIPRQHASPVAGIGALTILAGLFMTLVAHCLYEDRVAPWVAGR